MANNKFKISLNEPNLIGNEWKYLKNCLDTNWVSTAGKFVKLFEKEICKFTKSKYAICCINGTSALHISLKIAGVKSNDEVIVPSLTFIAPVNAIRYNNANPLFIDSDNYFNIDVLKLVKFLDKNTFFKKGFCYNKKTKRRISAIIPVHIWGNGVDIKSLLKACRKRNIKIIEDASESLGTFYKKNYFNIRKHTGTIGDFGCISFNGNKIITSGGGGVIITNSKKAAKEANYLINQAKDNAFQFIHNEIGYNYKLTNIQAALGFAQLENIGFFLKKKREIHNYYKKEINNYDLFKIADTPKYTQNNHWITILNLKKNIKNKFLNYMKKNNIFCRPIWKLNHLQKPYLNFQNHELTNCMNLQKNFICLPSSTSLSKKQLTYIVEKINNFKS